MLERPLRLLFIAPGALTGSHLPFVRREAQALAAAGHKVELYGFDNRSYLPWRFVAQALALRAAVRRFRPDVVHAQFGKFNALLAAWAAGRAPLVITFRGTDINRNFKYSSVRAALGVLASQLAAFFARGVVCVSGEILAKVWARGGRRCIVMPTGVDLRAFVPSDRAAARAQLRLDPRERVVLFNAGRNPEVKDPDLAAAAVAEARRLIGPVRLLVLDGTAPPEQVPTYMNAADCLILTSRTEGSPTVVQEAMACNLPVVSVDVGDVRERLRGVDACVVARSREASELGAALAEVLRAPRRSDGRAHAAALDVAAIAARLARFYAELLAAGRDRDLGAKYRPAD